MLLTTRASTANLNDKKVTSGPVIWALPPIKLWVEYAVSPKLMPMHTQMSAQADHTRLAVESYMRYDTNIQVFNVQSKADE